ncbi:kinase-like domain-containing protein [Fomes fomentarius]|nr:kinase-like domain-containing protein [Fomes fomentarius]
MSEAIPVPTRTARDDSIFVKLTSMEMFWRDRQEFFVSRGYTLRSRYRPDWIPSWRRDPTLRLIDAEDHVSWHMFRPHLLDGKRLSDGKLILFKRVASDSQEVYIASYLSSEELRKDPRNHCVPILDVLQDPHEPSISFLVMPFLRYIDQPEFDTIGSILECVQQLLEGLSFLHQHNVAHRDCAYKNIMMDATAIFPRGFHPVTDICLPDDITRFAPTLPRSKVPVTYYFVDFGISSLFAGDQASRLVTGSFGLDEEVPELSDEVPYDPFKVDIFILGNLFCQTFVEHNQRFSNVDVLAPLVWQMTKSDPSARPSAEEALQMFRDIRRDVWTVHSLWRPHVRDEPIAIRAILDVTSLCYVAYRSFF